MKKSMSWLDIRVWIEEQKNTVVGSYIDNLYLVGDAVVLKLRNPRIAQELYLVLEPSKNG